MEEADVVPKIVEEKKEEAAETVITKKDPKRVEQGKRLAAISKEAKEKKMRERIREEEFSYLPWLGYGISIVSSLGLFYFILFNPPSQKEDIHPMTIVRESPVKSSPVKRKKFESFN